MCLHPLLGSILHQNVSPKNLYTMGRNTKRPNTTKGLIKPEHKNITKIINEFLFYDLKLIRDCSLKVLGMIPSTALTIPSHASIIASRLEKNSTSNFSVLLPTTKHTYISAERTQNLNNLKIEIKCFQKMRLKSWERLISYYQGAWRLSSKNKDKPA